MAAEGWRTTLSAGSVAPSWLTVLAWVLVPGYSASTVAAPTPSLAGAGVWWWLALPWSLPPRGHQTSVTWTVMVASVAGLHLVAVRPVAVGSA